MKSIPRTFAAISLPLLISILFSPIDVNAVGDSYDEKVNAVCLEFGVLMKPALKRAKQVGLKPEEVAEVLASAELREDMLVVLKASEQVAGDGAESFLSAVAEELNRAADTWEQIQKRGENASALNYDPEQIVRRAIAQTRAVVAEDVIHALAEALPEPRWKPVLRAIPQVSRKAIEREVSRLEPDDRRSVTQSIIAAMLEMKEKQGLKPLPASVYRQAISAEFSKRAANLVEQSIKNFAQVLGPPPYTYADFDAARNSTNFYTGRSGLQVAERIVAALWGIGPQDSIDSNYVRDHIRQNLADEADSLRATYVRKETEQFRRGKSELTLEPQILSTTLMTGDNNNSTDDGTSKLTKTQKKNLKREQRATTQSLTGPTPEPTATTVSPTEAVEDERPSATIRGGTIRIPNLSSTRIQTGLQKLGYQFVRQRRHIIMEKKDAEGNALRAVIPAHRNVNNYTLAAILRGAGISIPEFLATDP